MGYVLLIVVCLFFSCSSVDDDRQVVIPETEQKDMPNAWHDKIRTRPYPQMENELFLNPSPLIVPKNMAGEGKIQFQLSKHAQFPDDDTETSEWVAWCMYNPHHVLDTGKWYWRFRREASTQWSETYQFEVTDAALRFVTPTFQTFLENAPRTYPRLYCFLNGQVDQARKKVASHPEYQQLLTAAQTAMDTDMTQWSNPYSKASQIKQLVDHLYQAYYLTQKEEYADKLHGMVRVLLANELSNKQLFSSNFDTTDILLCLIPVYDLLYDELTEAERITMEGVMLKAARYQYEQHRGYEENHIFDNHFWQQNMRVIFQTVFLLFDHAKYQKELLPMLEYYYEIWTARAPAMGFNRDGEWLNGTGYFINNVMTLFYMPMMLSYISRSDFLLHPWYQHAGQALAYTWPPESGSLGFGDGSERYAEPQRQRAAFADFLARELGDGYAGWYAGKCQRALQRDPDMRLYRMVSPLTYPTDLPSDHLKYAWYKDVGEVMMHSNLADNSQDLALSFRSSSFGSGSHTLADQNAFNVKYRGRDVYCSTGYYQNFSDLHNLLSYRHTRAHNTILVNGIGQPFSMEGYGQVLRAMGGEHIIYCLGDASKAYRDISHDEMWIEAFTAAGISQTPEYGFGQTPLTTYKRHILMLDPDIILVYDELEAAEPVRWDWLLHSKTPFSIKPEKNIITSSNDEYAFHAMTQLFCQETITLNQTDQFVAPPSSGITEQYPNQWHLTASILNSRTTRVLAVIQVKDMGEPMLDITRNGNEFQIGPWHLTAEMNASQAAAIHISHQTEKTYFDYRSGQPSQLYDNTLGRYKLMEQNDLLPMMTRGGL